MPILDQLKRSIDVAKFKTDQFMRINRIQSEVGNLRLEIKGIHEKIANAVVELHKQGALSHAELDDLCRAIDRVEARIAEREAQIAAIRAESGPPDSVTVTVTDKLGAPVIPINPCPNCHQEIPTGAAFCVHCGKPMLPQTD
jgi:hypothetical protein